MSDYGNSATLQLYDLGGRFGRWMSGCVSALSDDLAGPLPTAANCRTMIVMTDRGTEIHSRGKNGSWLRATELKGAAIDSLPALKTHLKGLSRQHVLLRISRSKTVVQHLTLPAGTLDVLPAVIRNKIESLAPWPISEAMWGHAVTSPPQAGQIGVDVGIVSRKTVQVLLAALAQASIRVTCLDISPTAADDGAITIDFLGSDRARTPRRWIAVLMSLTAAAALVAAGYGSYQAYRSFAELGAVEGRIDDLKQSLLGKDRADGAPAKLDTANALYLRKLENRPAVSLLNALTRLVPDGTWLNSLDYAGSQITISGRGTEIPRIIESLESSEEFASVNFASATQHDPDMQADSFSIEATVEPAEPAP